MKSEGGFVYTIGKNKKIIFFLKMWWYPDFSLIANLSGLSICQCQSVSVNLSVSICQRQCQVCQYVSWLVKVFHLYEIK